jgi:hypothetical protein
MSRGMRARGSSQGMASPRVADAPPLHCLGSISPLLRFCLRNSGSSGGASLTSTSTRTSKHTIREAGASVKVWALPSLLASVAKDFVLENLQFAFLGACDMYISHEPGDGTASVRQLGQPVCMLGRGCVRCLRTLVSV